MSELVTSNAVLECTFGTAPSTMVVLPINFVQVETPAANILDMVPLSNIMPFAMCMSIANPTVAAATAAALGVLTPMPCVPLTVAPWTVGAPAVLINNSPALTDDSQLMCSYAGVISITYSGQAVVTIS